MVRTGIVVNRKLRLDNSNPLATTEGDEEYV